MSGWQQFCCSVFLDFYISVNVIHMLGVPVGNTPKCTLIVSFGSTDLISSNSEAWLSKRLNSANGTSLNLSFGQ